MSAAGGLAGAAAMLLFGSETPAAVPYVLGFAAGNFLYVAMADLIPTLHRGGVDRIETLSMSRRPRDGAASGRSGTA